MKIRSTVILFGLFAAALLTFAAFQWLGIQTGEESKHAERFVFPGLNPFNPKKEANDQPADPMTPQPKTKGPQQAQPEEFTRLVIERNRTDSKKADKLEFNRVTVGKSTKWVMVSPVKVRTDDTAVSGLIRTLISLEKQKSREAGRDLSKLGLDNPDTRVTMTRGDKEYVLSLGMTGPATKDPVYYASSSELPGKPFILAKSKIEKLFDDLANYRDKSLISSSFGINGLKLAGTARSAMELTKDKDWTFKEPSVGEADTPATDELTRQLSAIKIERNEDFVTDGTDLAKLAQYGVSDDKPAYALTITQSPIDPKDKPTVETILVGNADDSAVKQAAHVRTAALVVDSLTTPTGSLAAYIAREKQKIEPMYYYARVAGDQTVVRIAARHLPLLQKTVDDLRAKNLAKIDNSKVDVAHITSQGESFRIYRPDLQGAANWDLYSENRAKVKCQPQAIQGLLDMVTRIEVRDTKAWLDDDAKVKAWFGGGTIDLGLDKPQTVVQIWQEGILRDTNGKVEGTSEPKLREDVKTKPTMKLSIGRKDDQRKVTYVRREQAGIKPVVIAVPDPFIAGAAQLGATQTGAVPPDGRQTYSISSLASLGYLQFRDRTLPGYRPDQITSVEVKRPGVNYLMEHTSSKDERGMLVDAWKLKQPVEGNPNMGVSDYIVTNLISTSTEKLITDRASEKDLDEAFGLVKAPLLQVVVKAKPEEKPADPNAKDVPKPNPGGTYTYTIGKKLADNSKYPNHYYARVEIKLSDGTVPDSNQFVIAVPPSYLQSLDIELRDGMVFPEDKTKPDSLQLTWNGQTTDKKPLVTSVELKLNNDKWEVVKLTENGTDAKAKLAKLDQAKVNGLLRYGPQPAPGGASLNPWVVDRFLQHTGAVDPKFRLDPASKDFPPRLVIEVKFSDGKSRKVILGDVLTPSETQMPAWVGVTYYYAATPALAGAVELVKETYWHDLIAGVDYFAEAAPKQKQ